MHFHRETFPKKLNINNLTPSGLGFLIDDIFLLHDPGRRHPESPVRLQTIRATLEKLGAFERWRRVEPRPATRDELLRVHSSSLIEQVEAICKLAPAELDPDTPVSRESYRAALYAVGGTLECIDAICAGKLRSAFAFVRPPGHHAEPNRSMGFCLFNNIAAAAAHARVTHNLDRVAIVDIDIHHGNGTQACFNQDPQVLYISTHQSPFYPGTGAFFEVGMREGEGYTVNFPLPRETGDDVFVPIYSQIVPAILEQFRPQLILVSAGFDAHCMDPLGELEVTTAGFAQVAVSLMAAAEKLCSGRICFVLEGGYSKRGLDECTRAFMGAMDADQPHEQAISGSTPAFRSISDLARRNFGHIWQW